MHQDNIELMEKFFRINRLLHQHHHQGSALCGVSCRGQGLVLSLLKAHPNINQKELSALLDIRAQSLGELLVRLEHSGCIRRTASEKDRRALNIQLTPKGTAAAGQAEQHKRESAELFDCLSTEEKIMLGGLVDRLTAEFLRKADKAAPIQQQKTPSAFERHHREE